MNLLQHARRRSLLAPESFTVDGNSYLGLSRPVNGLEKPIPAQFQAFVERVYKANGPVFALMMVRQLIFSEAMFKFRRHRDGRPGELFGTDALSILEEPWPGGTTGDLLSRMVQDGDLAGNSFWTIVGGDLKRLRPDWVTIVTGSESEPDLYGDALDGELLGYIYSPRAPGSESPRDAEILGPEQVAHFAPIPDPIFHFRGMSWLSPIIREFEADSAATQHKLSFFRNGATPQVVVSVDASVTPEQFKRFMQVTEESHAGADNAYKTLYLGGGADATVVGKDLQQLDFKATQGAGESRLAAAAGVPPVIAGFSEGLAGSSLNAGNYAMSRRRFADGTLRPLWRNAAGSMSRLVQPPAGAQLWYDDRDIAFLREDRADVARIQQDQSTAIRQLTDAGYEASSVIDAILAEDLARLRHTGLFSVQLQPPRTSQPVADGGGDPEETEGQE